LNIIIYTNNPIREEALMLDLELKAQNHISNILSTWDIDLPYGDYGLPRADLIYIVTPVLYGGTAFELANRLVTLEEWNKYAVLVNPLTSLLKSTKAHFTSYCSKLGIPHPRTLVTENPKKALDFAMSLFKEGQKIVVKPIARGEGVGIRLLGSMNSETMLRYLLWYSSEFGDRVFYLQEFVENLGYDVRLFVINGQVIGRMKRMSTSDFRYNLAQGGSSETFQGTEYDRLALESVEALDAKVAGVDIMPTRNGAVVMEVNTYPGFRGMVGTTGIAIPKLLVDYFKTLI
jgi:ribosomal protein S6--L-glutamate ligase